MQNLKIAKVLKPQGIKGEIKVECFTSDLDFLMSLKSFTIENKVYNIKKIRILNKFAFIQTEEINSRDDVENLRGKFLIVPKPEINPSSESENLEFFISDLENCRVEDENGNLIGFIDNIEKYGSADIINVMLGGATKSFPFLKSIIKTCDITNKKLVVFKNKLEEVLV